MKHVDYLKAKFSKKGIEFKEIYTPLFLESMIETNFKTLGEYGVGNEQMEAFKELARGIVDDFKQRRKDAFNELKNNNKGDLFYNDVMMPLFQAAYQLQNGKIEDPEIVNKMKELIRKDFYNILNKGKIKQQGALTTQAIESVLNGNLNGQKNSGTSLKDLIQDMYRSVVFGLNNVETLEFDKADDDEYISRISKDDNSVGKYGLVSVNLAGKPVNPKDYKKTFENLKKANIRYVLFCDGNHDMGIAINHENKTVEVLHDSNTSEMNKERYEYMNSLMNSLTNGSGYKIIYNYTKIENEIDNCAMNTIFSLSEKMARDGVLMIGEKVSLFKTMNEDNLVSEGNEVSKINIYLSSPFNNALKFSANNYNYGGKNSKEEIEFMTSSKISDRNCWDFMNYYACHLVPMIYKYADNTYKKSEYLEKIKNNIVESMERKPVDSIMKFADRSFGSYEGNKLIFEALLATLEKVKNKNNEKEVEESAKILKEKIKMIESDIDYTNKLNLNASLGPLDSRLNRSIGIFDGIHNDNSNLSLKNSANDNQQLNESLNSFENTYDENDKTSSNKNSNMLKNSMMFGYNDDEENEITEKTVKTTKNNNKINLGRSTLSMVSENENDDEENEKNVNITKTNNKINLGSSILFGGSEDENDEDVKDTTIDSNLTGSVLSGFNNGGGTNASKQTNKKTKIPKNMPKYLKSIIKESQSEYMNSVNTIQSGFIENNNEIELNYNGNIGGLKSFISLNGNSREADDDLSITIVTNENGKFEEFIENNGNGNNSIKMKEYHYIDIKCKKNDLNKLLNNYDDKYELNTENAIDLSNRANNFNKDFNDIIIPLKGNEDNKDLEGRYFVYEGENATKMNVGGLAGLFVDTYEFDNSTLITLQKKDSGGRDVFNCINSNGEKAVNKFSFNDFARISRGKIIEITEKEYKKILVEKHNQANNNDVEFDLENLKYIDGDEEISDMDKNQNQKQKNDENKSDPALNTIQEINIKASKFNQGINVPRKYRFTNNAIKDLEHANDSARIRTEISNEKNDILKKNLSMVKNIREYIDFSSEDKKNEPLKQLYFKYVGNEVELNKYGTTGSFKLKANDKVRISGDEKGTGMSLVEVVLDGKKMETQLEIAKLLDENGGRLKDIEKKEYEESINGNLVENFDEEVGFGKVRFINTAIKDYYDYHNKDDSYIHEIDVWTSDNEDHVLLKGTYGMFKEVLKSYSLTDELTLDTLNEINSKLKKLNDIESTKKQISYKKENFDAEEVAREEIKEMTNEKLDKIDAEAQEEVFTDSKPSEKLDIQNNTNNTINSINERLDELIIKSTDDIIENEYKKIVSNRQLAEKAKNEVENDLAIRYTVEKMTNDIIENEYKKIVSNRKLAEDAKNEVENDLAIRADIEAITNEIINNVDAEMQKNEDSDIINPNNKEVKPIRERLNLNQELKNNKNDKKAENVSAIVSGNMEEHEKVGLHSVFMKQINGDELYSKIFKGLPLYWQNYVKPHKDLSAKEYRKRIASVKELIEEKAREIVSSKKINVSGNMEVRAKKGIYNVFKRSIIGNNKTLEIYKTKLPKNLRNDIEQYKDEKVSVQKYKQKIDEARKYIKKEMSYSSRQNIGLNSLKKTNVEKSKTTTLKKNNEKVVSTKRKQV